jgi:ribose 1,5-bisphosphokinase PhnN
MQKNGQLFLIVGNSGSGKDTLLKEVLRQWPASAKPIRTPQRYITRPAHASEPFIFFGGQQRVTANSCPKAS